MNCGTTIEIFHDWTTRTFYIVHYVEKVVVVIDQKSVHHPLLMQLPTPKWEYRNPVVDTYDFTNDITKLSGNDIIK